MAWTLIGEDTFTTGSDTNLNVWTPTGTTPLSGWTKLTSQISAQAVVKAADDTLCQPYHSGTANPNPYTISNSVNSGAQKSEATGFTSSNRGLVLHGVNATTYWNGYYARYNSGISAFEILRVDNGVRTQLTTGRVGSAPVASDVVTFESDGAGSLLVANNGTTQCSASSSTYIAGKPGVAVEKSFTGTGLDNYKAYHVAGSATHPSSGALTGPGTIITGTATHTTTSTSHDATGTLTGQGAATTGTATHLTLHAATGVLTGQGAAIAGTAAHAANTIARPNADTYAGAWLPSAGSDLYAMLDEVSPDDTDYIYATTATTCEVALNAVSDPGTSSGQVVSYRVWSPTGDGLTVTLKQGAATIATWTHATLPTTATTYQQALTAGECDAITDYTALSFEFTSV